MEAPLVQSPLRLSPSNKISAVLATQEATRSSSSPLMAAVAALWSNLCWRDALRNKPILRVCPVVRLGERRGAFLSRARTRSPETGPVALFLTRSMRSRPLSNANSTRSSEDAGNPSPPEAGHWRGFPWDGVSRARESTSKQASCRVAGDGESRSESLRTSWSQACL